MSPITPQNVAQRGRDDWFPSAAIAELRQDIYAVDDLLQDVRLLVWHQGRTILHLTEVVRDLRNRVSRLEKAGGKP